MTVLNVHRKRTGICSSAERRRVIKLETTENMSRKQEVRFLLTDLDYKMPEEEDQLPTIRLFGKTEDTQVLVKIRDFVPYLYVKKNKDIELMKIKTVIDTRRILDKSNLKIKYYGIGKKNF